MWACSFKSLVAFCVRPPACCHRGLGSCAAEWISVVLPCRVLNLSVQHCFSHLTLQLQRLFWRCSSRNGRKPWLIGKVENWKIRIIGVVFLLVSSVTLGEALRQMYLHQDTAAKGARKVPSDFGDTVVLNILGDLLWKCSMEAVCISGQCWATLLWDLRLNS